MIVKDGIAVLSNQGVLLGRLQVCFRHLLHKFVKSDARLPAEFSPGPAGVAQQRFHFCGAVIARIHGYNDVTVFVHSFFVNARAVPGDFHVEKARRKFHKLAHAVLLAGGDDVVPGLSLCNMRHCIST